MSFARSRPILCNWLTSGHELQPLIFRSFSPVPNKNPLVMIRELKVQNGDSCPFPQLPTGKDFFTSEAIM